jgi:ankyrin repeat protein
MSACCVVFTDANCFNEVDCLGRTAIMYAVQSSSLDTLQLLLEQYADVNALAEGLTAIPIISINTWHLKSVSVVPNT